MTVAEIVRLAEAEGATVVRSAGATIIVLATSPVANPDEMLPIPDAARLAATSTRVLKDAIRAGGLSAFGGQRDRSVRRGDLLAWVASRKAPIARVSTERENRIEKRLRRRRRAA